MFAAPALPLLFMGEEYGETSPFQFFTSFLDPDLAEAVRAGRTAEFKRFAWQGDVPDPGDPATFLRSRSTTRWPVRRATASCATTTGAGSRCDACTRRSVPGAKHARARSSSQGRDPHDDPGRARR